MSHHPDNHNERNRGHQNGRPNSQGNGQNQQQKQKQPMPAGISECVGCGRRDFETPMVRTRRGPDLCADSITDTWDQLQSGTDVATSTVKLDLAPRLDFLNR
jgi:hypothetical protein